MDFPNNIFRGFSSSEKEIFRGLVTFNFFFVATTLTGCCVVHNYCNEINNDKICKGTYAVPESLDESF